MQRTKRERKQNPKFIDSEKPSGGKIAKKRVVIDANNLCLIRSQTMLISFLRSV